LPRDAAGAAHLPTAEGRAAGPPAAPAVRRSWPRIDRRLPTAQLVRHPGPPLPFAAFAEEHDLLVVLTAATRAGEGPEPPDGAVRARAGDFAYVPAGTGRVWRLPGPFEAVVVRLDPLGLAELLEEDRRVRIPAVAWRRDLVLAEAAAGLRRELGSPRVGARASIDGLLLGIGVRLLRRWSDLADEDRPPPRGLSADRLRRVEEHAAARLAEDVRLEDLAAAACLSPTHFARAFKASTGVPPRRWLTLRRAEAAAAMLAEGRPIAEVAYRCGFASQSHMTDVFRRLGRGTPGTLRRGGG
jgi:AraC family transcriptional regulator